MFKIKKILNINFFPPWKSSRDLEHENKLLRESLKKSQESDYYLKVAVKSNLDAIICVDSQGKIIVFNPAAEELFQYKEEEVLNQSLEILLKSHARTKHQNKMEAFLKDGVGQCGHLNKRAIKEFQRKDGTIFIAEHSLAGARGNGKVFLASTIRDITEQIRLEEKIKLREEKFRNIFNHVNDAIFILDLEKNILDSNDVATERLGYSKEELRQMKSTTLSPNERQSDYEKCLEKTLAENSYIFETTHVSKHGKVIPTSVSTRLIEHENKPAILAVARDITQIKKTEKDLRKSKERLKLAIESANLGLWDQNFQTGEVYRNDEWSKMLGYESHEINNHIISWKDLIHPDDLEEVDRVAKEHETRKSSYFKVEHRLKTKSGDYKWILNWGRITDYDDDGSPLRAVGTHIDINDRKRAEESLQEAHNQFLSILESLEALIYVIDMNSNEILFMNKKAKERFGNIVGKKCWELLHSHENGPCELCNNPKLEKEIDNPQGIYEWEYYNEKTGRWYEVKDKAIRWTDNRIVRLEIAFDITEQKNVQQKLEELNDTKDRLFSIIGHDLKNPLSDIIGFSELLNVNYESYSSAKVKRFHELIYYSAKNMHGLLNNLLEWSRFHSGQHTFKPERFDLKPVVDSCLGMFKSKAENKKIQLYNEFDNPEFVFGDRRMIETVMRNLLSNAVKYTEDGGHIGIYKKYIEDKIIISVLDNGLGIRNEEVKKIFMEDYGQSTMGTSGETGTGLGLIICKDFIEKHGEKIWVDSEPGEGSEFQFTLPRKEA